MSPEISGVAVALIHEAREFGDQLRQSLASLGLPVVYEARARAFDRAELERSRASVVVVNLDAQDGPDLDEVYSLLDDARYRVVFNDNEVSNGLSGWDHARWLRHLTAKIVGAADIDPPRPADAEAVSVIARTVSAQPDDDRAELLDRRAPASVAEVAPVGPAAAQNFVPDAAAGFVAPTGIDDGLFDLDAILEQLDANSPPPLAVESAVPVPEVPLAPPAPAAAPPAEQDVFADFGIDIDFDTDTDLAAAGNAAATQVDDAFELDGFDTLDFDSLPEAGNVAADESAVSDLAFGIDEDIAATTSSVRAQEQARPAVVAAPSEWSLEDILDDAAPALAAAPSQPADFGIETMSAAEFLAHDVEQSDADAFPSSGLALELIPLEEAVAPTAMESAGHENRLEAAQATIRRVWVLGASIGGPEAVREFLTALPRDYPALFLLAQHLGDEFVDMMAKQLARGTALTVRMPTHGERVAHGDVVIVPAGQRLRVDAFGVVVMERDTEEAAYRPSIDRVLRDAADRFGANAGAIVFSGMGDDAVEGCTYLAAKGGAVYAQQPETCVVSTMIDGVCDTGVVSFLGSPQELAEKLMANPA